MSSLLVVGSCSRVTQNVVSLLARGGHYSSITIADLLPVYHHHQRFYELQAQLKGSSTKVGISKLISLNHLSGLVQSHQHVLNVTHDYFHYVTSKHRIAEATAQLSKNKEQVVFAAPIEYDHYEYASPLQHNQQALQKVKESAPSANFVTGDVQDGTELYAYLNKSKGFLEEKLIDVPSSFTPRVVSSQLFAEKVVEALVGGQKGQSVSLQGEKEVGWREVAYNRLVSHAEMDHHQANIRQFVKKYTGTRKESAAQA